MAYDPEDFWEADDFEDNVAAALIACYEGKIKKNKGIMPPDDAESVDLIPVERPIMDKHWEGCFSGNSVNIGDLIFSVKDYPREGP